MADLEDGLADDLLYTTFHSKRDRGFAWKRLGIDRYVARDPPYLTLGCRCQHWNRPAFHPGHSSEYQQMEPDRHQRIQEAK